MKDSAFSNSTEQCEKACVTLNDTSTPFCPVLFHHNSDGAPSKQLALNITSPFTTLEHQKQNCD